MLLTMLVLFVAALWSVVSQGGPERWKDAAVGALCGALGVGGVWMILSGG